MSEASSTPEIRRLPNSHTNFRIPRIRAKWFLMMIAIVRLVFLWLKIKDRHEFLPGFGTGLQSIAVKFLDQAKRQIEAADAAGYEVRWYFSEKDTADFAQNLFEKMDEGRERIKIIWEPSPGKKP
jgi:hypothetical protein